MEMLNAIKQINTMHHCSSFMAKGVDDTLAQFQSIYLPAVYYLIEQCHSHWIHSFVLLKFSKVCLQRKTIKKLPV